ncbi:nucleoside hydrolase [Herbaspirillum rubrisubalbicans]|uniref:Nucleoside hydrolase n=1 Tax=Herbaspirillum rubrisubalbicans TaxID=80842 RepID=A0AAD0XGN6_9BURK|nr:nucleoside hydrolase [Herbaspirillum rubrisubalbicans]AYR24667.1 nucleoside hydrolase [Herbaspirillum rubrisubalbicans]
MRFVIIDCDPGIDDALALFLAAGSVELTLLAVTTTAGNRPAAITAGNARKLMDLAGRPNLAVHAGAERPLSGHPARCNLVHGEDGLGGVLPGRPGAIDNEPSALALVRHLREAPAGSIDLVAMGPLTNLALAELLVPGTLRRVRQLSVMGGALRVPGNITPAAEFNFYVDPLAADVVMRSGAAIHLYPLDVTHQALMSSAWLDKIGGLTNRCGQAAAAMLRAYAALDPLLHDVCPVAGLLRPTLFTDQACSIEVDWRPGFTEGYTLAHLEGQVTCDTTIRAATTVDNDRLLGLVFDKISGLP